jgi:hypothetical protein
VVPPITFAGADINGRKVTGCGIFLARLYMVWDRRAAVGSARYSMPTAGRSIGVGSPIAHSPAGRDAPVPEHFAVRLIKTPPKSPILRFIRAKKSRGFSEFCAGFGRAMI